MKAILLVLFLSTFLIAQTDSLKSSNQKGSTIKCRPNSSLTGDSIKKSLKKNERNISEDKIFYAPSMVFDFTTFGDYWSLHFGYGLREKENGKLFLGLGGGSTWSGGEEPPGTNIDEPFSWFTQTKDFETRKKILFGSIGYLFKSGLMLNLNLEFSASTVYNVYKSTETGWYWNKLKEDKKEIGIGVGISFFIIDKFYLKGEASSIRGFLIGGGFGF